MTRKNGVPGHIGIIMDGNGRWAAARGMPRTQGHLEGLKAAKRVVKAASLRGVSFLTLYTFSTENRKRPLEEVSFIMGLVKQYLRKELDFYRENRIRIRHAGDLRALPAEIRREVETALEETKDFEGMQVILALNYGGRDEILRAVAGFTAAKAAGTAPAGGGKAGNSGEIPSEAAFRTFLDNPDIPDPDLIIRSAGEFRTSNFLLWQSAYAEYYVSEKFWPEWDGPDLDAAISWYASRDRRFGGVKP